MKKALIPLIFTVFGLLVGFGLGQVFKSELVKESEDELVVTCKKVVNKIAKISAKDIEEYLNLGTQKKRYEKANEILGQLVQMARKDLKLKVSPEQLNLGARPILDAPEDHFEKRIIDRFDVDNSPATDEYKAQKK